MLNSAESLCSLSSPSVIPESRTFDGSDMMYHDLPEAGFRVSECIPYLRSRDPS